MFFIVERGKANKQSFLDGEEQLWTSGKMVLILYSPVCCKTFYDSLRV